MVTADATLALKDAGPEVAGLVLAVNGMIGGFSDDQLRDAVDATRKSCPVYLLLEKGLGQIDVSVSLSN